MKSTSLASEWYCSMTHYFPKVRFDERSAYPKHGHPDGEEIFVLEGSWLDENGIHPKVRGIMLLKLT